MSTGFQQVTILGRMGQDPEVRYFPDGNAVTTISLATSESWKDRQTGQKQERTEWHKVVVRDRGAYKMAEIVGEYVKKGDMLLVIGTLKTRSWEGQDGHKNYVTEIHADNFKMLSSKSSSDTGSPRKEAKQPQVAQKQPVTQPDMENFNFDDDIPF